MTWTCKERCKNLEHVPRFRKNYDRNTRRCSCCDTWFYYDGLWCPCCGQKLRTVPRRKTKEQMDRYVRI